ncbi:hypothetical protein AB833_01010 [Chromatiales bacterium (ex Bugula neritina AB1)]|nr:hypothetical protein AB833_01010 [Chromatiales bacterium (ex Bugula neritina AB1)]
MSKKVLIVGATGVAGSAFIEHIRELQASGKCDWDVIGVTRQGFPPAPVEYRGAGSISYVTADLLADYASIKQLSGITHVVFAGFVPAPDFAQQVAPNRDILVNCLQALDNTTLEHVTLIQGMKYYGSHLGPFKTPAREDDARHEGENYYYAQQDVLEHSGIAWTCLRPHVLCGTTSIGTPQNILSVIGVYATLMREQGRALSWPGTEKSFACINQATDAQLLAEAIAWSLQSSNAVNQAFNVTNGDFFRWQHLWPKIAELHNMQAGGVETQDLSKTMPLLSGTWQGLISKYGLEKNSMEAIVNWPFADYILRTGWDVMASTVKIRQHGFQQCLDTEEMYVRHLLKLQELKILPA